jgi:hypothetical protein
VERLAGLCAHPYPKLDSNPGTPQCVTRDNIEVAWSEMLQAVAAQCAVRSEASRAGRLTSFT